MNNVLSVVLNAAEGAAADPTADTAPALGTIRDAVRRGSSMMHELMTFAGESRMTLMRANPKMVLEDARQLVSRVVGDRVAVAFDVRGDVPDVDVDLNQFWKVFFNIVKNAGEAMGGNAGHVTLAVVPFRMTKEAASAFISEHPLPEGDGVLFRITDDGPGIPERIRSRIFDPYVSSKSLGRGLGLTTVRATAARRWPSCGATPRGSGRSSSTRTSGRSTRSAYWGAFRLGAPHVPVILASGSAREAVEQMFRAHPYDVFLQKPYTLAELKGAFLAAAAAQDPVAAQDP